jgi:hypothetical protein
MSFARADFSFFFAAFFLQNIRHNIPEAWDSTTQQQTVSFLQKNLY